MTASGLPTFALNLVEVTQDEAENGIHYYFVEAQLQEDGYDEPYVHYDEFESPEFLHPAVGQYLDSTAHARLTSEEPACCASSN
jgi:hypothetical protein